MQDQIVDEIRSIRHELAARHQFDLRKIVRDLHARQGTDGRVVVRRPPRRSKLNR